MSKQLHWLPFPQRIQYKLCTIVYKCLHNKAPSYLSDLCVPVSSVGGHFQLRSATAGNLCVPATKTVTMGQRGFSTAGPSAWNSLPTDIKDFSLSFETFKTLLKTYLFRN